ncbi:MAG: ABC transporter substrate-binding protein [Cyanobacteria bacterium P01_F01_bin.150]
MSQSKNDAPVLIISLLLTLGLLAAGGWWAYQLFSGKNSGVIPGATGNGPETSPISKAVINGGVTAVSRGESILIASNQSPQKSAGVEAIAQQNYPVAIQQFEQSLAANRNDPEALIYLNNSQIGGQAAYTIAVVVPSPAVTNIAEELLRGAAQSQRDINQAGGINGVPLKVTIASDNDDPSQAKAVAQWLTEDPSILGVIGHFSSGISLAAIDIYQAKQMVMMSPTSTSVDLSNAGDYAFRTVQSDAVAANSLAQYMLEQAQLKQVAVFYNSESNYSKSLKGEFSNAILTKGGRVVSEFDVKALGFNASQAVNEARERGAEAIMLATTADTQGQALDVIAANGRQLQLLGGDELYTAEVLKIAQANAVGMVVAVAWHRDGTPNAIFPKAAQSLWGGPVSWRTAMAYDASQAFINAIEKTGLTPDVITPAAVQQALIDSSFSATGAADTVSFLFSGDRSLPPQLVVVRPGVASGSGYDYAPLP